MAAYTTIEELKTALVNYANNKGVSATRPVILVINDSVTQYKPIRFVVAHTEPHATAMPVNLMWYVLDPVSPNFGKLLRRVSRSPANGYTHTWVELTVVDNVWAEQSWDTAIPADQAFIDHINQVGNAHGLTPADLNALSTDGGILVGALIPRTPPTGQQYANNEVVPRSWIDALVNPIRTLAQGTKALQTNLNSQFINLRNRVVVLEAAILGSRVFAQTITEPADVWIITHNFNKPNVFVTVYNEDNEEVMPGTVKLVNNNTVRIDFAKPVIGRVEIGKY